jgi:hypothetical protein
MKHSLFFGFASLALVAGCTAPAAEDDAAAETSEAAYSSGVWQKLMTCNGGAAVLDVDTGDRRNVELVIRDRNVVDYLQSKAPNQMVNAKHEIVIRSGEPMMHGLFSPRDFGQDDFWSYRVPDFWNAAIVQKDGRGIKVTIAKRFEPICEGGQWGYQGGCWGGHTIRARVIEELANWYFDDCR